MENVKLPMPVNISEAWWNEVCKKLKNAVVFLDNFVTESLHWSGDLERLIKSGCKDVKEFSAFEVCQKDDEKAVFLLGGLITGVVADTLRVIIKSSNLKYVIVVTGAHPSVHSYAAFGGREVDERVVINRIEEQILEWLGNLNYTAEIFFFPLILVQPTKELFLLPIFHDLFPIFEDEIEDIMRHYMEFGKADQKTAESMEDLEFRHLPFNLRVSIYHFIVCLHSYLQGMFAREEIYTIGHFARIVGGELETYNPARQRRRVAANKVSLVIVDRVLDLVSPTDYGGSILMNRLLTLLPRLPGHIVDSAVDLNSLSSVHSTCDWTLVPGCFAHQSQVTGQALLEMSINSSKKETLSAFNLEAKNALRQEQTDERSHPSPVIDQLSQSIKHLHNRDKKLQKHFYLVQQSLAVIEVMKHSRNIHLDQLHSVEKMLLHSIDDPLPEISPFYQVLQLLKTRAKREVKVEEILVIFLYLASLGNLPLACDASEYAFTNAISQAFVEDKEKDCDVLSNILGDEIDEMSALKAASRVWHRLQAISKTRNHLKDYRYLHKKKSDLEPNEYRSLIAQLLEDCLGHSQTPVKDLEYKSAGLKDIIKTGFSLFVNVTKPRPKDAALLLVYVLGGVTPTEVSEVKAIVDRENPSCKVLIGSSHLTYPSDIVQRSLKKRF